MKQRAPRLSHIAGVCLCAMLASLVGCSPGDSPLSPGESVSDPGPVADRDDASLSSAAQRPAVQLTISPLGLAKRADDGDARTKTRKIRAKRGGAIALSKDRTFASLLILPGSMAEDERISMTLSGSGLATTITFGPSGTTFNPAARFYLSFPANEIDPDDIVATLTSEDGKSEPVKLKVYTRGSWLIIEAAIPHFSLLDPDLGEGDGPGGP